MLCYVPHIQFLLKIVVGLGLKLLETFKKSDKMHLEPLTS